MNLAENASQSREPQAQEWVQSLIQLPDEHLLSYFSQWSGWTLSPLSDLTQVKPILVRMEQLLRSELAADRLESVSVLLVALRKLQQAAGSRNMHFMSEALGEVLDLDDWNLVLQALALLQASSLRSYRLFRPQRSQELSTLAYKLYTLAMGANVNNSHTFTFQEMHAAEFTADFTCFTYRLGDQAVQLSTEDSVPDLKSELLYALRCRRRLARTRTRKEAMLAQLLSVSALLKTQDAQYVQELWKSYPELWLLPSLISLLRDPSLTPVFHKQILEVMRAMLLSTDIESDSSREREVANCLQSALAPAQTHGLLQTLLRDLITGSPGLLPQLTCENQAFLKSTLALVEAIAVLKHRSDNAHIPGLVSLLLQMLVSPCCEKVKPQRLAKASQVLCILIQHSIVMFKELDGLQVTLDLLLHSLEHTSGQSDRLDLIHALFQLMETALKCWDQQPGMINNQISKIATSPLLTHMQTLFSTRNYDLFDPCISLLSLMIDEQPALPGDLAQKGLLLVLFEAMEQYSRPNPALIQTFSRFLWKVSVHRDGVSLLESSNVVDCILHTLRSLEVGGSRRESTQEIASNLKEISMRVPSIRVKIMDSCVRTLASLKSTALALSREDFFSQLSSISFLLSNLLHLSEDMIEMFIQTEGLDLFFELFKLPILPVSLDSEMQYAVTCFQNLNSGQFSLIFHKVVDAIEEITGKLELLLGPLRSAASLSTLTSLPSLSPLSPEQQVTVTLTSLTSFIEMAVWLLRFTSGSADASNDIVSVIASLGQLFRLVVYEETRLEQARLQGDLLDPIRCKLISITVVSLQNLLRYGTSIGTGRARQSDENLLNLLVCASETLCAITSSIELPTVSPVSLAFAGKLLTNLMKILFHKYSSALSLVAFHNGEGTKSVVSFVHQLKAVTYELRTQPDSPYAETLEQLWAICGQFFESLATWEYSARSSMTTILKNFGVDDVKQVTRLFQTAVLDAMDELDYKDCSELSTGFMKNILEVVRVLVEELKDTVATDQSLVTPLMEMGFSEMKVRQALQHVGGASLETAMEWLLTHADMPEDLAFQEHDWQDSVGERLKGLGDILVRVLSVNPELSAPVSNLILILAKKNGEMVRVVTSQLVQMSIQQLGSLSQDLFSQSFAPPSSVSVLSILQQLALLSQRSPEVLDILLKSQFQSHLSQTLKLIASDLRILDSHPLILEPIFTLLNSILKYSGQTEEGLVQGLADLLRTNASAEQVLVSTEGAVVALLALLGTVTNDLKQAETFLEAEGLYHVFTMRAVSVEIQMKTVLPLLTALCVQLMEDPYILEATFSVDILAQMAVPITLESMLKSQKKNIQRNKAIFLKAFQAVCQVVKTSSRALQVQTKSTEVEIDAQRWSGAGQLLRALADLYEWEQVGKSGRIFGSEMVLGLLGETLQQYPLLLEPLLEERYALFDPLQGAKVTRPFISHLVRNLIPYRYALRYHQGSLSYTYPSSNSQVPAPLFDIWVKAVAKLVRALCFRQSYKGKQGSAASSLYVSLILRQNKPVLRARKYLCKELKEILSEVTREDWFGAEPLMSQLKACILTIMQLLKEAPRSSFVLSSPAEVARALISDQGSFLNLLCEAAKGVRLTVRKSTSLLSTILASLELLTRYGITFALRSAKQPLDTEAMIEEPVENQEPMQLQEEPNSSEMVLDSEEDQEHDERPRLLEEGDSQDFEAGEEDDMMNLMMIEGRHGDWEDMEEPPRFLSNMARMDLPETGFRMQPPAFLHPRAYDPGRLFFDRMSFARNLEERDEDLMQYLTGFRYEQRSRFAGGPPFARLEDGDSFEEMLQVMRQRRRRERNPGSAPVPQTNIEDLISEIAAICASLAVPQPVQPAVAEEPRPVEQSEVPVSPPAQPDVDPAFLEALPEQIRNEVLQSMRASAPSQVNEDVMSELPLEIQEELRQEQSRQQRMAESMDNATMVAMLAPDLRRDVLLTASEDFLNSLSEDQVAEAQLLRERMHRVLGVDRQSVPKPVDQRKDVAEIVTEERLCDLLIQPSDSFLDLLFRALYLVNPVNKEVLGSLFLNLSAQPLARAKIMEGLMALLKALDPRGDFPPHHLLGSESFGENYQQVYAVVSGRILDILQLLTHKNPKASQYFVEFSAPQRTPLILAAASDEESGFKSLLSLVNSRLYQSSTSHLIPLLTVLQEVIEREAQHPPVLDQVALSQICSMLSFESLGDTGVTIVVDIIHKLSQNPENRALVEPAVTADLIALKTQLIALLSTNFASADVQKQVQLLRLCKVLKNVNPEAQLTELEELWTHLSCTFKTVAESEGEGTGLSAVLTRLLPLVETYFVAHSDCETDEVTTFFSDKNRKMLNLLVKQNPALLESTLVLLTERFYSLLDFENKREYFKSQTNKLHSHRSGDTIRLKIHRNNIFIDSFHKLKNRPPQEMYGRLQVDFIGEEGLDLGGPTREWYSSLSREMFNPDYALFVLAANGVSFQPNPRSYVNSEHLDFFRFVGKIIGKALVDGVNLELHFTRSFYKHILGQSVTVQDMEDLDPEIYKSLQQLLSLDLDSTDLFEDYFTYEEEHFGNVVTKELVPNGKSIRVTEGNKAEYVQRLCNMKMTDGIRAQIEAFLEGLYSLVKKELLAIFDSKELELLIAGLHEISVEDLQDNTEYQGYAPDSPLITWFWEVMEEFSNEQRAQLLQFVTGSSKVPLEGFKALRGSSGVQLFQIHKSFAASERLPTAHTW